MEEEFLDWTMRHFTERRVAKSGRRHAVVVEVVLSREEAEQGGDLPIQVPAFSLCPDCEGRGRDWFSFCPRCDGEGVVGGNATLRLRIPPMVRDGTMWRMPLVNAGLDLHIHIRVDPFS